MTSTSLQSAVADYHLVTSLKHLVDRKDSSAGSLVTDGAEVLSKEGLAAGCGALAAPVDTSRKTLYVRCERAHHEGGSVSSPLEGVRTTRMETLEASL